LKANTNPHVVLKQSSISTNNNNTNEYLKTNSSFHSEQINLRANKDKVKDGDNKTSLPLSPSIVTKMKKYFKHGCILISSVPIA